MSDLTRDDVIAQLEVIAGANGRDADDLLACTVADLQLLAQAYRESAAERDRTGLDKFEAWLDTAARIAGPVATIAAAIAAMFGVAAAVKAL